MTTQVATTETAVSRPQPAAAGRRDRKRGPLKKAYSAARRLVGGGRFRPWLDCTVIELFEAEVGQLRRIGRMPRAYNSRFATRADQAELAEYFGSAERVRQRLDRGDVCAVVLAGERICAGAWLTLGPATVEEDWNDVRCRYHIPAGTAWGYDGRGTKPGAWGSLMACLPGYLTELGADRMVASIHYNNHLSIDSHLSTGFHSVGWIACVRFLGLALRVHREADGGWCRMPGPIARVEVR
ncbi:MAG: hypothetical protein U1E05_00655 [Patescibacteria group bacterium]|nr:hypothetical protein [Patescibacteria group bacterium]